MMDDYKLWFKFIEQKKVYVFFFHQFHLPETSLSLREIVSCDDKAVIIYSNDILCITMYNNAVPSVKVHIQCIIS